MSFDSILNAIETKTDREINLFNSKFENILSSIESLVIARGLQSIKDPLQFDFVFQNILQESGYYNLINEFIDDAYDKNYQDILEMFKEAGIDIVFTQDDLISIAELKQLDIQTFRDIGAQAANALKKDLYKYSLSNLSTAEIADNIRQSLAGTSLAKYSKTYAETSISNYNQAIMDLKIQDIADDLVYIYRGATPDKKIRDFCKCVMNKNRYYTRKEAQKLKTDKRRQWNCRHKVVGVSEDFAIEEGYVKGDFTC